MYIQISSVDKCINCFETPIIKTSHSSRIWRRRVELPQSTSLLVLHGIIWCLRRIEKCGYGNKQRDKLLNWFHIKPGKSYLNLLYKSTLGNGNLTLRRWKSSLIRLSMGLESLWPVFISCQKSLSKAWLLLVGNYAQYPSQWSKSRPSAHIV